MNCIFCRSEKTAIVDSRKYIDFVERRRQCLKCNRRFTTIERKMEYTPNPYRTFQPIQHNLKKPQNYYTVYNKQTDEIIASGTSVECANQLEISLTSFFKAVMRTRSGESKKYDILVESMEDIDEGNDD